MSLTGVRMTSSQTLSEFTRSLAHTHTHTHNTRAAAHTPPPSFCSQVATIDSISGADLETTLGIDFQFWGEAPEAAEVLNLDGRAVTIRGDSGQSVGVRVTNRLEWIGLPFCLLRGFGVARWMSRCLFVQLLPPAS